MLLRVIPYKQPTESAEIFEISLAQKFCQEKCPVTLRNLFCTIFIFIINYISSGTFGIGILAVVLSTFHHSRYVTPHLSTKSSVRNIAAYLDRNHFSSPNCDSNKKTAVTFTRAANIHSVGPIGQWGCHDSVCKSTLLTLAQG